MTVPEAFTIRPMRTEEISIAVDWAAAEGWNPGLSDAPCFGGVDAEGFLLGELDGQPAATISIVKYDQHFAFLGFYIVRPDLRGCGFGWRIWQAAMAHAGNCNIGLDGVLAQQDNYLKSGFVLAHRNIRYGGIVDATIPSPNPAIVPLGEIRFADLESFDSLVFPAPRPAFLKAWIAAPSHYGQAFVTTGSLRGWGLIRPCRNGHKIGPLFADTPEVAQTLFRHLISGCGGGQIFIDSPESNPAARNLAETWGLEPVFETARMYTNFAPSIDLARIYGITSFELG